MPSTDRSSHRASPLPVVRRWILVAVLVGAGSAALTTAAACEHALADARAQAAGTRAAADTLSSAADLGCLDGEDLDTAMLCAAVFGQSVGHSGSDPAAASVGDLEVTAGRSGGVYRVTVSSAPLIACGSSTSEHSEVPVTATATATSPGHDPAVVTQTRVLPSAVLVPTSPGQEVTATVEGADGAAVTVVRHTSADGCAVFAVPDGRSLSVNGATFPALQTRDAS